VTDHELDPRLRELLPGYHQPPPAPRAELWARLNAARGDSRIISLPARRRTPVLAVAGLAAALLLAFGLGRLSVHKPQTISPKTGATPAERLATEDYLGRVEIFLTDFRTQARMGRPDSIAPERARQLLSVTRLLLDSPGGRDPRVRPLLEDLELVLAEITQLPADQHNTLDLITDGLDRRGTLSRVRSAVSAGSLPVLQGEL